MLETILFIAVIGLSIWSSINKQQKKNRDNKPIGPQQSSHQEITLDDVLKELTGRSVKIPVPAESYSAPAASIHPSTPPSLKNASEHVFSGMESSKELEYLKKPKKNKLRSSPADTIVTVTNNNPSESNEDIIANFDLRKAVLYSEIMAPKFKEYEL